MSKNRLVATSVLLLVFALGAGDCDCDCANAPSPQLAAHSGADSQGAGLLPTGK